jgi:hypothetical protein
MARWRVPSNRIFRTASSRDVKRLDYAEPHEWDPKRISQVVGMVSGINKAATGILGMKPVDMITAGISKLAAPGEDKSKPADTREDMLRRAAEARAKRDRAGADLRKMRGAGDAGQPGLKPGDLFPEERGKTDFDALLNLQGQDAGAGGAPDLSSMGFNAARRYARSTLGVPTFKHNRKLYSTIGYEPRFEPRKKPVTLESKADHEAALAKARARRGGTAPEGAQPQPTGPALTPLTGIRAPAMTPLTGPAQPRMPGQMPQLKLREDLQPIPGEPEVRAVPNAAAILQMDSGKGGTMMDAFQGRLDAFVDKGEPQYDLSGQLVQPKYTSADLRPLDPQLIGALLQEGPEGGAAFERLESLYGSEIAEHIQFIAGDFRPILKSVAASMPQYEKAVVEPVAPVPTAQLLPPSIVEAVEPADRPTTREAGDVGVRGTTAVEDARARERARMDRIISGRREESPAVRAEVVRATGAALNQGRRIPQDSLPNNVNDITAIAMITTDRASLPALIERARKVARPTKFSDLFTGDHEKRATERVLKSFKGGEGFRVTPAQAARIKQGQERNLQGRTRIAQAERKSQMDAVRLQDRLANSKSQRDRRSIQNQLTSVQFRLKALKYQKLMNRLSRKLGPKAQKTFEGYIKKSGYRTPAEIAKLQGAARADAQAKLRNFLSRDKTRKWMRRNKFAGVANETRDNLNVGINKPKIEKARMGRLNVAANAARKAKKVYDAAVTDKKTFDARAGELKTAKDARDAAKKLVNAQNTPTNKAAYSKALSAFNSLQQKFVRAKNKEAAAKTSLDNAKSEYQRILKSQRGE